MLTKTACITHYQRDLRPILPPFIVGQFSGRRARWLVLDGVLHLVSSEDPTIALHFIETPLQRPRAEAGFASDTALSELIGQLVEQLKGEEQP